MSDADALIVVGAFIGAAIGQVATFVFFPRFLDWLEDRHAS